ncbi:isoamyl acetate-hydrolyzing esterase [Borealophlyctis nickersoniae]|nr:isoamyl acetate-hydrolyzing esterase [Borealophlyctis nickersoniae]
MAAPEPLQLNQILLFGDSITQRCFNPDERGWGAYLSNAYARKVDVMNRGYSGYNTQWCKPLLPSILRTILPPNSTLLLATIFLGANDAVIPEKNSWQYVPLDVYKQNLIDMVGIVREVHPCAGVLLITPPPIDPTLWGERCKERGGELDRSVENTRRYRDACIEAATEVNTPVLDTWEVFLGPDCVWEEEKAQAVLVDGLHLNEEGNKVLGPALLGKIQKDFPQVDPDKLPNLVPLWAEVDKSNFPECLFLNVRK